MAPCGFVIAIEGTYWGRLLFLVSLLPCYTSPFANNSFNRHSTQPNRSPLLFSTSPAHPRSRSEAPASKGEWTKNDKVAEPCAKSRQLEWNAVSREADAGDAKRTRSRPRRDDEWSDERASAAAAETASGGTSRRSGGPLNENARPQPLRLPKVWSPA